MKHSKLFSLAAVAIFTIFSIFQTSCRNPCKHMTCLHGGTCSDGTCLCPTGYTGAHCEDLAVGEIDYYNKTFTPVYITVGSQSATIPDGGSEAFTGQGGSSFEASASTYETTASGTQLGLLLTWDLSDHFPSSGAVPVDINVSSSYFYLYVVNTSPYYINNMYVNRGSTAEIHSSVGIPNDGGTYGVGYYDAYNNSNVYLYATTGSWYGILSLPFISNQSYTFYAR
jgi:hypothetical protein